MSKSTQPNDQRAATEVPRNTGHPPGGAVSGIDIQALSAFGDNAAQKIFIRRA